MQYFSDQLLQDNFSSVSFQCDNFARHHTFTSSSWNGPAKPPDQDHPGGGFNRNLNCFKNWRLPCYTRWLCRRWLSRAEWWTAGISLDTIWITNRAKWSPTLVEVASWSSWGGLAGKRLIGGLRKFKSSRPFSNPVHAVGTVYGQVYSKVICLLLV